MATNDVWGARADQVGSLLRPDRLIAARDKANAGQMEAAELRAMEDDAIREVVRMQEAVGLRIVTDGEYRRASYSDSFTASGITGVELRETEREGWSKSTKFGSRTARLIPAVVDRIEWAGGNNARDFAFLRSVTSQIPKITLPGPGYIHYRAGRANISRSVYPDLDRFWSDLVDCYVKELRSLADVGCTHLQMDETSFVKLGDARVRAILRDRGDEWSDLLDRYIEAMNAIAERAPTGMKLAVHICRSQNPNWQANASYEPIAEKIFNALKFDVYFLEYDNANAGSFEPLCLVPPGKRVVLGLISTRVPEIENIDDLKRRVEEASRYIPLTQLAIGPQCGFSTNLIEGVHLTSEIQRAKLALVAAAAREIWPGG